jgi:hypothetical protein
MKKRTIGVMCLDLLLLASTTVSATATHNYDGKMRGYVDTTRSIETSNSWIHV